MKVASFNVQNYYINKKEKVNNLEVFFDILDSENIDILSTQELTYSYVKKLKPYLNKYNFYGKYRTPFKRLPFNENNNIITNKDVIKVDNIKLPWIPRKFKEIVSNIKKGTLIPRIATIIIIKNKGKDICIINTHLTNRGKYLRIRQLNKLIKVIDKYSNYPIILTGDFNTTLDDSSFKEFIDSLKSYNISRVSINENTWYSKKGNGKTIDHIFVSNSLPIKDYGIIKTNNISDHDLIYVEI